MKNSAVIGSITDNLIDEVIQDIFNDMRLNNPKYKSLQIDISALSKQCQDIFSKLSEEDLKTIEEYNQIISEINDLEYKELFLYDKTQLLNLIV